MIQKTTLNDMYETLVWFIYDLAKDELQDETEYFLNLLKAIAVRDRETIRKAFNDGYAGILIPMDDENPTELRVYDESQNYKNPKDESCLFLVLTKDEFPF